VTGGPAAEGAPTGPSGRLLVTTREPAAVEGEPVHVLPAGMFSPREAVGYLSGAADRGSGPPRRAA